MIIGDRCLGRDRKLPRSVQLTLELATATGVDARVLPLGAYLARDRGHEWRVVHLVVLGRKLHLAVAWRGPLPVAEAMQVHELVELRGPILPDMLPEVWTDPTVPSATNGRDR